MTRPHVRPGQGHPRFRVYDLQVAYAGWTVGRRAILHAPSPDEANQLLSDPNMLVGPVGPFE